MKSRIPAIRVFWKGQRLIIVLLAAAIYFFGATIAADSMVGSSVSFSRLWHLPVLQQFVSRGCHYLPLWWSAPGAGVPLWAAGYGGQILANPIVLVGGTLGSPALALWFGVVVNFLIGCGGCIVYFSDYKYPRALTWAGSLAYAASPFVVGLNTEGWASMAAVAAALPWTAAALRCLIRNPTDSRERIAFVLSGCYACLIGGWSYFIALLLASLFLTAQPFSWKALCPPHSWRWFTLAILVIVSVGAIFSFPHVEFLVHSGPGVQSSLLQPQIVPLGVIAPVQGGASRYVPYFSVLVLLALLALPTRPMRELFPRALKGGTRIVACFLTTTPIFVFIERTPWYEAFVTAATLSVLIGSLMVLAQAQQGADLLLRRNVFLARRYAISLFAVAAAALFASGITQMSSPPPASLGAKANRSGHVRESERKSSLKGLASKRIPDADNVSGESQPLLPASQLWLRQALLLIVVAALFWSTRSVGARRSLLALLVIVLLDLRLSYPTSVASGPKPTAPLPKAICDTVKTDAESRVLAPSGLEGGFPTLAAMVPNLVTYPSPRLPKQFAHVLQKHPMISSERPRISEQTQLVYLASSGIRWILLADGHSRLDALKNLDAAVEEHPWKLYQLSPRPLRVQIWQRATRVHDAAQALALTLSRDWHATEIYVEGPVPSECLRPSGQGTFGRGEMLWDIGSDIAFSLDAPLPAIAVFSDCSYPGWKAWLGDKPAPLLRANGWMRALTVPAGRSLVRMTFHPASFRFGAFLSLIGLTAAFVLLTPNRQRRIG